LQEKQKDLVDGLLSSIFYPTVSLSNAELYMPGTSLAVTPSSSTVGQTILLTGSGFGTFETVYIYADKTSSAVAYTAGTDASGNFTISGPIYNTTAGQHTLIAVGQVSHVTAQTPITILPQLVLSPTAGTAGSTVHATGSGFGTTESVQLAWDAPAKLLGSATTNSRGNLSGTRTFSFTVPRTAARGPHTITATGQTTQVVTTVQFTVR